MISHPAHKLPSNCKINPVPSISAWNTSSSRYFQNSSFLSTFSLSWHPYATQHRIFRSFAEVIKIVGKKHYPTRGKKIDKIIDLIKSRSSFKVTLGGCIVKKVNGTVIFSKE